MRIIKIAAETQIMCKRTSMSRSQVAECSSLFKMEKGAALEEIADQLHEFKVYALERDMRFLAYLLEMAEIETRNSEG